MNLVGKVENTLSVKEVQYACMGQKLSDVWSTQKWREGDACTILETKPDRSAGQVRIS